MFGETKMTSEDDKLYLQLRDELDPKIKTQEAVIVSIDPLGKEMAFTVRSKEKGQFVFTKIPTRLAPEWKLDLPAAIAGYSWSKLPLAVIDFETTGLDPTKDKIIEYGVALFKDGEFKYVVGGFVNPEIPISEAASKVNGITDNDVKDAPVFRSVYNLILATVLDGFIPVAYNAPFDREFLHHEMGVVVQQRVVEQMRKQNTMIITPEIISEFMTAENFPPACNPDIAWIDPLVWVRHLHKYEKSKKLTSICKLLHVQIENAHRASSDAKAAGEVLLAMAPQIKAIDYYDLIAQQNNLAVQQAADFLKWRSKQRS